MTVTRHPLDHGWVTDDGYLCDGCTVRSPHEHRCHRGDAGPVCSCSDCDAPSPEALAAFMAEMDASSRGET